MTTWQELRNAPMNTSKCDSPDQFERKLNLARRRLCRCDEARARDGLPALVKRLKIVGGRSKVRTVQYIEKLSSELNVEALRNSLYIVVLEHGEVQFRQSRTYQCVAAQVAGQVRAVDTAAGRRRGGSDKWHALRGKSTRRGRKSQTLSLDIVVGVPRVGERLA